VQGFQTAIRLGGHVDGIYLAHDIRSFRAMITLQCRESRLVCSRFHYHAHWRLHSIRFTCEADDKILS
jgi:hypothetical protein